MRLAGTCLIFLVAFWFSQPSSAQVSQCGSTDVQRGEGIVFVYPNGTDDTANLQCAFDEAAVFDSYEVRLTAGHYFISGRIFAERFEGTFTGRSMDSTVISVQQGSVVCDLRGASGIFEFSRGDVTVKSLEIEMDRPCIGSGDYGVIMFTAAPSDCEARTVHGTVNRVRLRRRPGDAGANGQSEDSSRGVIIAKNAECPDDLTMLGTLKINRSEISGFDEGVRVHLTGAGQVDINFNAFSENKLAVAIWESNTNTTITGNIISYNDYELGGSESSWGVGVGFGLGSVFRRSVPKQNRVVVHRNRFLDAGINSSGYSIVLNNAETARSHFPSFVISSNTFELASPDGYAVFATGADDGVVVDNTLRGETRVGISVLGSPFGTVFAERSTDWVIANNRFNGSGIEADIVLDDRAVNCTLGPQNATYIDHGYNTLVGSGLTNVGGQ